jgi:hypothetical protein
MRPGTSSLRAALRTAASGGCIQRRRTAEAGSASRAAHPRLWRRYAVCADSSAIRRRETAVEHRDPSAEPGVCRWACSLRNAARGPGGRRATAFGAPRAVGLGLLPKPARRPLRIRHAALGRQGESITRHADLAREREAKICYVVGTIDRPCSARNVRRFAGRRRATLGPNACQASSALRSQDLTIGRWDLESPVARRAMRPARSVLAPKAMRAARQHAGRPSRRQTPV